MTRMYVAERTLCAVLPPDLATAVRELAKQAGISVSSYIRDVLQKHVEQAGNS